MARPFGSSSRGANRPHAALFPARQRPLAGLGFRFGFSVGDGKMADINGTAGDDVLFGTAGDDTIQAGAGHDYLRALGGQDELHGEDGDDYLEGGPGDDLIDGGAGLDRVAFHTATSGIQVDLNIQGVAQNTLFGMDTLIGIEHASGTFFADTLIGNGSDNWLWGEGGDDSFSA